MSYPYNPSYKGKLLRIVESIRVGEGYSAVFIVYNGDDVERQNPIHWEAGTGIPLNKTPQEAIQEALKRAHEWIDASEEA